MEIASARRAPRRLGPLLAALLELGTFGSCRRRRDPVLLTTGGAPVAMSRATAFIRGRVVDRRDRPVPDARILAFAAPDAGGDLAPLPVATDFDGSFAIESLAAGAYRVLIEATGFPATERSGIAAPASGLVLRLDGEGRSIAGRVELAGAPTVEATVALGPEAGGPVRQTRTRGDGGFVFGGLGAGSYALRAAAGALVSQVAHGVEVGRDGARAPLRLTLEPGQMIAGRVVEDAGAGLDGVEVRAELAALAPGEDPLPVVSRTDSRASFTLGPFLPGSYRLTAARPGYVLRRAPTIDLGDPGATPAVVLELLRGASVTGRVTNARGAPVASARVRCVASAMDDLTVETGPLPLAAEAAALPSGAGRALGSTRVALADGSGRFVVADLIPGRYRVEVAHPGLEPMRTDELVLAPGQRRDLGTLGLRDGFPVEGRVVDDGGSPIEGARVVIAGGSQGEPAAGLYALTDPGGRFSLAVPAGSYEVVASAPGHGSVRSAIDLQASAPPPAIELRLARAEAVLEGLVRDAGGRPLARARLLAWPRDAGAGAALASPPLGGGATDVGGHFRMTELPPGELSLEVQHPDYPATRFPAAPGRYALLTVPLPGGIAGEAHVRSTGAAVPRGRVEAAGPDGAAASAELRRAGGFRLPRLVPGRWRLTVSAPGFRPSVTELDVPASLNLGEMSVRDLRIDLDPV
jgi:Carboxypeptidase regulatory-like domain